MSFVTVPYTDGTGHGRVSGLAGTARCCGSDYAVGLLTARNGHRTGSAVAMAFIGSVVVCTCISYDRSHGTTVPVLALP